MSDDIAGDGLEEEIAPLNILTLYRDFTRDLATYPVENELDYLVNGLASEAGEVAGKLAKYYRGDFGNLELKVYIAKELGDVLWMVVRLADHFGLTVEDLIFGNMEKLKDRLDRGVLQGNGDDR